MTGDSPLHFFAIKNNQDIVMYKTNFTAPYDIPNVHMTVAVVDTNRTKISGSVDIVGTVPEFGGNNTLFFAKYDNATGSAIFSLRRILNPNATHFIQWSGVYQMS
jgi:hypothetical protein